jgi:hypothetical protein
MHIYIYIYPVAVTKLSSPVCAMIFMNFDSQGSHVEDYQLFMYSGNATCVIKENSFSGD